MERHFTYADIEQFMLSVFYQIDEHDIVRVTGVKLLSLQGCAYPVWLVELKREWRTSVPLRFACLVTESLLEDKPRLSLVSDTSLPTGCHTAEEEDAEIARERTRLHELRMAHEAIEAGVQQRTPEEVACDACGEMFRPEDGRYDDVSLCPKCFC